MSDYVPNHLPGHSVTYVAGATVTGGQVVKLSATGRTVVAATAGSEAVVGVACHDAISGAFVTVSRGGEQRPTASGTVTAGVPVKSGAAGTVASWVTGTDNASLILGVALDTVADTLPVNIAWRA